MPLSTITTNSIADDAITVPKVTDQILTNRNLIINGAMQVWQRATAATTATNQCTTVDRHATLENTSGNYTTEQSTDTPSGTGYSLKCVVTAADATLTTTEYSMIQHGIEAQNLQHLQYGTSSAKTLTATFWVKSNKTGTYGLSLYKQDPTSAMYNKEYTINTANTWEKKEIIITPTAGSTSIINTSTGTIANDTGPGLYLVFGLAWGPSFTGGTSDSWSTNTSHYATTNHVNWMDTVGNDFYLTEVQLEVGDTATPFEHRSYGEELAKCQRYYNRSLDLGSSQTGPWYNQPEQLGSGYGRAFVPFNVVMRAVPTMTVSTNSTAYTAKGTQFLTNRNFTSYLNGMTNDNYITQWTADAEL